MLGVVFLSLLSAQWQGKWGKGSGAKGVEGGAKAGRPVRGSGLASNLRERCERSWCGEVIMSHDAPLSSFCETPLSPLGDRRRLPLSPLAGLRGGNWGKSPGQ